MADELGIHESQLTVSKDFDFTILVPSESWVPKNSCYSFEIDPSLEKNATDDSAVILEKSDNKATKLEYGIAAASGLLTGALSILWMKELSLENAKSVGDESANKILVNIAKSQGFKPKTGDSADTVLQKAIVFMENKFPSLGDKLTNGFGGGLNHHLRDFSHHPSIVGLICSILMQFTGKGYGTDTEGNFIILTIPNNAPPADKFVRKVINGTTTWVFHLISDMAGSRTYPGQGTGIPGVILSLLKEASTLPFFKKLHLNTTNNQVTFSQWISKLFNGTLIRDKDGNPMRFDFRAEMGFAKLLIDQAKPVLINECIVRGFYFIYHFIEELKDKKISSIQELNKLDASRFLPYKSRALTRMLTVSTGVFEIVNISGAAVSSAIESGGVAPTMLTHFLLRINYVGAVRFAVACCADAKYIGEDVREMVEKYKEKKEYYWAGKDFVPDFKFMRYTDKQIRYLYSLQWNMVQYDMANTELDAAMIKSNWLDEWKEHLYSTLDNPQKDYLIDDEDLLYSFINYEATHQEKPVWLYAFAIELIRFTPYYSFDDSKKYDKLHFKYDYLREIFCKKQSILSFQDILTLKEKCAGYEGWIRGDLEKILTNVGIGVVCAFVPFGFSLASLLGAGISTVINILGEVSHLYTLNECSKLITLCDYIILSDNPTYQSFANVCDIYWAVKEQEELLAKQVKEAKQKHEKKAKIKAMESSQNYLRNCAGQLNNLLKRKGFDGHSFSYPVLTATET